jgi:hypothetical protein
MSTLDQSFTGPMASWKSVKDFGAIGDGIHDDTAAIQAALNALKDTTTNTWSTLYFPPGTYRITQQLTTSRTTHDDYLGAQIIGADPSTTKIVWDGAAGGTMLRWDAWYDKISRLTFDGNSTAAWGVVRAGSFSTYSELSDLQFQDFTSGAINLGNNEGNEIGEELITRDRFYRCGTAISTWDGSTLNIYIWHNYFEDNNIAIRNASGAFDAYDNRFVRSKVTDINSATNMVSSIVNNVSLGSRSFIGNAQNIGFGSFLADATIQGNKVYAATSIPLDLTATKPVTLIDNLIQGPSGVPQVLMSNDGTNKALFVGDTFASTDSWPLRVTQQPFDHGQGAAAVIGHPIEMSTDGDPTTYAVLGMFNPLAGWQWNAPLGTRETALTYALTSSPDSSINPMDWVLYGSNDYGQTWTPLDARTGETFSGQQRKVYTIQNPGTYSTYELQINKTANGSTPGTGGWVSLAEFELLDSAGQNIVRDPASLLMGADEQWGQMYTDQQSVVAPSSIQIPTSLQPFDFAPTRAAPIIEVSDFTGAAIQAAINQAAAMPAGTNPVVHLKKGTYNVSSTITIPGQIPITIVGDGASEHGSVLAWTGGPGAGPVVWLKGPSRVTLQDLDISGGRAGGVDGVLIDNANQQSGRIYGYEVQTDGAAAGAGDLADAGFDISGLNQTAVDINASGFMNFQTGVRVTGGPGHVQFLTGSSSLGNRLFDVKAAGALLASAYWYEGDWPYAAPLLDLPSTSSGTLSLSSMFWTANSPYPTVQAQSFPGTLTILNSALNPYPSTSPFISITGDGSQTNILSAGNDLASNVDAVALTAADQTNPPGQISQIINSNAVGTVLPAITNEVVAAQPTPAFLESQLALQRTIDTTAAVAEPIGATDVKLLRVFVSAGDNRVGVKIVGAPPPPPTGTTTDMILRGANTSPVVAGQYEIYDVGNNTILAGYSLGQVGTDWAFVTRGRFFGSDTGDMVLRNSRTGGFEVYDISNNNITNAAFLGTVGLNWQPAGVGDFNYDSMTDMVLRNSSTGAFVIYNISNNAIINAAFMGTVGLNWQVGGFGNFSSLGESDMILRNMTTGGLEVYDISNNQITSAAFMGTVGLEWQIIGVGNFSSIPGETDMIMRNTTTGGLEVYDIANNQITGAAFLGTVGLDWQFAGVAPVHGPGASDLVLRNVNTGQFYAYNIANGRITGAALLGTVGVDRQLGGFAANSQPGSTSQLVQAMAGFGGSSGAADNLSPLPLGADISQQPFVTTPHA